MADNESTISMEAEVSVNATKAVSGVDKLSKSIEGLTKGVSNLSKELESALKNVEKIAATANQSVSTMSKADINNVSRQLSQAPQRVMPTSSKVKNKRGKGTRGSNTSINQSNANQIENTTHDFNSEVVELVSRFKGVVSSLENINKNVNQLNDVMDTAERKSYEAITKRKNAQTNQAREVRKQEELSSRRELDNAKALYYKAQASARGDDYRFKPGLYGGIASGISGMNSRLRSRSGFAGFAARVGTGVGQKLGMNAFKGATMSGLGINLGTAAFGAAGVAVTKLVEAIGKLSVESVRAYGEVEKLKTSLSVVYGSDVEANVAFSGIKDYALESPFGIEQSTEMAILLKQSGVYGTELLDVMKMIGDTAGGNEEKFRRIANNYAQIASIGKASMLDMRQFAYAGIPIYQMVADELKVSQSVLRQMISDGEVTNEVIEKVFKTMTSEGGTFYKAVERGAATLNARLVNLQDAAEMAKAAFGEWVFNLDVFGAGSSIDGEGTFGKVLTYLEDLAAKADAWMSLINIEKDVAAISGREEAIAEIDLALAELTSLGKDTTALAQVRADLSGLDTPDSTQAIYTRAHEEYEKLLEDANNITSLQEQLNGLNEGIELLSGEAKKVAKKAAKDLEDRIEKAWPLSRSGEFYEELWWFREAGDPTARSTILGKRDEAEPYWQQSKANELVTTLFEQGLKTAGASSSLNTFVENANLRYRETDAGKAEALEKERIKYEENYNEFNRLKQFLNENGTLVSDLNVQVDDFITIMESGIIEPLEKVSLSFHDIVKNTSDTAILANDKQDTWQGMQTRARGVQRLAETMPTELMYDFSDIYEALYSEAGNTEDNVKQLNAALTSLLKNEAFKSNELARYLVQYITTKNASVAPEARTWQEVQGGKGTVEEFIPLWKRITGSATGIDPSKITTAKDFYEIYSKQFQSRNLSQGVISGMVASGRSARDITRNLRYTGQRSKEDDTLLIDWERTAEVMHNFAMSAEATVFELQAYQSALEEQIGVYDTLKETIFTTGEDWDKLDGQTLQKQLENAFSGIDGAKMVAVNDYGEERLVEFNEKMELVFKGTDELVFAQNEYKMSMERTIDAIDEASNALVLMKQNIDNATIEEELEQAGINKSIQAQIEKVSADYYLKTGQGRPDTISSYLSAYIQSMLDKKGTGENVALANTQKESESSVLSILQRTERHDIKKDDLTPDYLLDTYQTALSKISLLKEQGADPFGTRDIDDRYNQYDDLASSIERLANATMAGAIEEGDLSSVAGYAGLYYATRDEDSRRRFEEGEVNEEFSAGRMQYSNEMHELNQVSNIIKEVKDWAKLEKQARRDVNSMYTRQNLGMDTSDIDLHKYYSDFKNGSFSNELQEQLKKYFNGDKITLHIGQISEASVSTLIAEVAENPSITPAQAYDKSKAEFENEWESRNKWDLNNTAQMMMQGFAQGHLSVGHGIAGSAMQSGMQAIQGTDGGAFLEGMKQGGPFGWLLGLINMIVNALIKAHGNLEILSYSLNAVSHLFAGFEPLLRAMLIPAAVTSQLMEMLGDAIKNFLTWIFGEEFLEDMEAYYDSLTGANEEKQREAELLKKLNDQLENTRKAFLEAEEYYMTEKRHQNAVWAIEAQGLYGGQNKVTNVNDMILTPHGNFSTAPDDYIMAMKDPTALMGTGGGGNYVQVKFIVNNNASDVVSTDTEEKTGEDGQKELIVTISKMVAQDYATGKNGWDAAYTGRQMRTSGRSVTR